MIKYYFFLDQVIMCTREKKRARQAAFNLLVTAGNMYCEIAVRNADEEKEKKLRKVALAEYFQVHFFSFFELEQHAFLLLYFYRSYLLGLEDHR